MMMSKLDQIIKKIKPLNREVMDRARVHQNNLTKPQGSLGILENLSILMAGITKKPFPECKRKVIITMAADHGVVEEGVSAYPKEVTRQMVYNFVRGGAGINVLARHVGSRVVVVDMGVASVISDPSVVNRKVNLGTKNFKKGPAMTREEAIRSVIAGIETVEKELKDGVDILGTGDMGIGNTTASSAITSAMLQIEPRRVTGRGTGIDDARFETKVQVIEQALALNKPSPDDPLDVLSKVGGFEIGGLAGVMLAGAAYRIPVVIDGFISGAAALIAAGLAPKSKDYLIAAHCSVEVGHKLILEHLGLSPLFNLNMRLGEGTGAALGINLVEASCKILAEMATFESAGVSEKLEGSIVEQVIR